MSPRAVAGLMQVAAVHVGTSAARLQGTLIAVSGAVIASLSQPMDTMWVGRPQNTAMYLSVFSFAVAGCLAVTAGFHSGAVIGRDRLSLVRRGRRHIAIVVFGRSLGDLVWLWAGLAVACAASFVRTAQVGGGWRWDSLVFVGLGAGSVAATYACGMVVGTVLRHPAFVLAVAPLPYAATLYASGVLAMSDRPGRQVLLGPFIDEYWFPHLAPVPMSVILLAVYVACIGAAALSAAGLVTARHHGMAHGALPSVAALCLLGAVGVGAHLSSAWSPTYFSRENPAGATCTADQRVCVWTDQAHHLKTWAQAEAEVAAVTGALPLTPRRMVQLGVAPASPTTAVIELHNPNPSGDQLRAAMFGAYTQDALAKCDGQGAMSDAHQDLVRAMETTHAGASTPEDLRRTFDDVTSCG